MTSRGQSMRGLHKSEDLNAAERSILVSNHSPIHTASDATQRPRLFLLPHPLPISTTPSPSVPFTLSKNTPSPPRIHHPAPKKREALTPPSRQKNAASTRLHGHAAGRRQLPSQFAPNRRLHSRSLVTSFAVGLRSRPNIVSTNARQVSAPVELARSEPLAFASWVAARGMDFEHFLSVLRKRVQRRSPAVRNSATSALSFVSCTVPMICAARLVLLASWVRCSHKSSATSLIAVPAP